MILLMISLEENPDYRDFLTELYDEHKLKMYCYAYNILHDEGLAEDAVNLAFTGIITNVEKIFTLDIKKTQSYIVISIRNACYNIAKKRNKAAEHEFLSDKTDDFGFGKDISAYINTDDFSYVRESLNVLSERSKNVVLLKYFVGCSYKEIADTMNISVEQVGVILNRAKTKLKAEIIAKRDENGK